MKFLKLQQHHGRIYFLRFQFEMGYILGKAGTHAWDDIRVSSDSTVTTAASLDLEFLQIHSFNGLSTAKNWLVISFAELFAGIKVVLVLFFGHVHATLGLLGGGFWVLESLVIIFGSFSEAFTSLHVARFLGWIGRGEPQVLPQLEVHVRGAVRWHTSRLNKPIEFMLILNSFLGSCVCFEALHVLFVVVLLLCLGAQLFVLGLGHRGNTAGTLHTACLVCSVVVDGMLGERCEWVRWVFFLLANVVRSPSSLLKVRPLTQIMEVRR